MYQMYQRNLLYQQFQTYLMYHQLHFQMYQKNQK
jgi:hypothetical protein